MADGAAAAGDKGTSVVKVSDNGNPAGDGTAAVLKEVGAIVDTLCDFFKVEKGAAPPPAASPAAPPAADKPAEVTTLKSVLMAAGLSSESLALVEKAAGQKGVDLNVAISGSEVVDALKAKKFTDGRIQQLRAVKEVVDNMLAEVDPPPPANLPASPGVDSGIQKSATPPVAPAAPATDIGALVTKAIGDAIGPIKDQLTKVSSEVEAITKARAPSNSMEADGGSDGTKVTKASGGDMWKGVL